MATINHMWMNESESESEWQTVEWQMAENSLVHLFNVQHKAHLSDLVRWVSICPSINDKSLSRLLGIAILSRTVSTLWQHPGWFFTDKGTFSGLEKDDIKLRLVQSSERHCVTPQIWFPIHCQQGSLQFLSLDITQMECQSSAEDPIELPYNV